jgi:hypothetical protein
MLTTIGISLYSCLYLKLAKTTVFLVISVSLSTVGEQKGGTGSALKMKEGKGRAVAQIMYTHESRCKNNKIKFKNINCIGPKGIYKST